ncbi:MAG: hypothetical protein ACI9WS_000817 [Paraglaciecola psychrophila]|jgi:hypothetical protein
MSEQQKETESRSFFEEFGPLHEIWARFERGMQIMLGVALITLFGFLGESWGGDDVPYEAILAAVFRIAWAFSIMIFLSPAVMLLVLVARKIGLLTRKMRGVLYFIILLAALLYCWSMLYISTIEVVNALVEATNIAHPLIVN